MGLGSGSLTGTTSVYAEEGVATFTDLVIDVVDSYVLVCSIADPALSVTADSLSVEVGPAVAVVFSTQPSASTGGVAFSTQPVVSLVDAGGNVASTSSATVTVSKSSGSGTLSGTVSMSTDSGVADFAGSDLSFDVADTYVLHASAGDGSR